MQQRVKWIFYGVFIFCAIALIMCAHSIAVSRRALTSSVDTYWLIDPGHGGEDGGASAADGTLEKSLNLTIAQELRDLLTVFGVSTRMTRDEDVSIHDAGCTTTRQMKVSDMNNRLKLYNAAQATVSIHQNHFSVAKYHGAQVFYSVAHPKSCEMATAVRASIRSLVQPDNTRELKKATDSIYLLHRTSKPAILVECGFLSNPQECEKLKTPSYQQQLALAIAVGVLEVYHGE